MKYAANLGDFFHRIVEENKNHLAIKFSDSCYTYEELDLDSHIVALFLLNNGIQRGDVIAIINSKHYISFVLMLACLKIGIIYTNVDPDSPSEFFADIINVCKPKKIFTDIPITQNLLNGSKLCGADIETADILLNQIQGKDKPISSLLDRICIDGDAIAYIMFTSGSTGKPKGVAVTHQNLIHFINWSISRYEVKFIDIFANVSPMYFDNSVFDFYTALFSGACIAPIKKQIVNAPDKLIEYVDQMRCTIWFSVPSLLIYLKMTKVLKHDSLSTLRIITFGGEGYPKVELKKIYDLFRHRIKFINVYGPTECTCICTSYTVTDEDFVNLDSLPPLGKMNPNITYLILNEQNQPDSKGELCLFGPNVARGYYNDFERTAGSFFYYTGNGYYQAKMYRTGDLVHEQDGLLYFIARKDNQIKHMGYRIELDAIEIAIGKIDGVNEVVVTYCRNSTAYGKIIAFIASFNENISASYIKDHVRNTLPEYMLPNHCIFLEYLPKNANGKIDRVKLKNSLVSLQKDNVLINYCKE